MKTIPTLLGLGLSLSCLRADYLPVTYDTNGFFHLDSGQSTYVGYKPDTYSDAQPISLLVWLHGCGGEAEGDLWTVAPPASRQTQSYIAISIGGRDGDCWSVDADTPKVLAAIADVSRYFNINPRKIYLAGCHYCTKVFTVKYKMRNHQNNRLLEGSFYFMKEVY